MSVELQNIVSKMMADSVPEEQIAAVIQQYKQASREKHRLLRKM
jgi:hypothetical protein